MSARRLTACRILGAFGLACVATFLILGGLAVIAAAQHGNRSALHHERAE